MSKVKVTLRVNTIGASAGDEIEVESQEIADNLVANGHALKSSDATPTGGKKS